MWHLGYGFDPANNGLDGYYQIMKIYENHYRRAWLSDLDVAQQKKKELIYKNPWQFEWGNSTPSNGMKCGTRFHNQELGLQLVIPSGNQTSCLLAGKRPFHPFSTWKLSRVYVIIWLIRIWNVYCRIQTNVGECWEDQVNKIANRIGQEKQTLETNNWLNEKWNIFKLKAWSFPFWLVASKQCTLKFNTLNWTKTPLLFTASFSPGYLGDLIISDP